MTLQNKSDHPNRRVYSGIVWLGVCMDEDINYGDNVIAFGMAGSGIIRLGTGNQQLLPDRSRMLLKCVGGVVHRRLSALASKYGTEYLITAHAGCGGGAQDIIGQTALEDATRQMAGDLGVPYFGFIPTAAEPVEIGNTNHTAHIGRPESVHQHDARRLIFTTGGGITQAEIRKFEADGYGDAFVVSADILAAAIRDGSISQIQASEYLLLHLDVADGITEGLQLHTAARIFDAGRLPPDEAAANRLLAERMIARIPKI